jgi:hypothetical protein
MRRVIAPGLGYGLRADIDPDVAIGGHEVAERTVIASDV